MFVDVMQRDGWYYLISNSGIGYTNVILVPSQRGSAGDTRLAEPSSVTAFLLAALAPPPGPRIGFCTIEFGGILRDKLVCKLL